MKVERKTKWLRITSGGVTVEVRSEEAMPEGEFIRKAVRLLDGAVPSNVSAEQQD